MKNHYKISLFFFLLFWGVGATAQTGPAGIRTSTENIMWFDAGTLGLANGDPVATWSDISGNGNNVSPGSGGNSPTYNTGLINGLPGITFDGSSAECLSAAPSQLSNKWVTHFVVANVTDNSYLHYLLHYSYFGSNRSDLRGTYFANTSGSVTTIARRFFTPLGTQHAHGLGYAVFGSKFSGTNLFAFTNGDLKNQASNTFAGSLGIREFNIGRRGATNDRYFTGEVAEVIVFNELLNNAEINIIHNYLSSKYNLAMDANDYYTYEASGHSNGLVGIGQESDGSNTSAVGTGIITINTASDLNDGEYLLWAHDDGGYASIAAGNVPTWYPAASGERLTQSWRIAETGDVGTYTVSVDLTGITFGSNDYHILIDADGDFTSGAITITDNYTLVGDVATWTSVDIPDGYYFTIGNSSNEIISITTGNWNTATTWNCTCVPTNSDEAIVDAGHTVSIDANSSINNLTIAAGGTLNFSGANTLDVKGNLTVNGSYVDIQGTTSFTGTGTQEITNSSGGDMYFNNVTFNNINNFNLNSGTFIVLGTVQLSGGTVNTNGNPFILRSNAAGTARIGQRPVFGANGINGTITVQRYIQGSTSGLLGWREISAPVGGSTAGDLDDDIYVSGTNFDGCAWGSGGNCFHSIKFYVTSTGLYDSLQNQADALGNAVGYDVYMGNTATTMNDTTLNFNGTLRAKFPITKNVDAGWNLIGNPYASQVDWGALTLTAVNDFYYIYNVATNNYESWDEGTATGSIPDITGNIAIGQGFWVEATGAGSVQFAQADKTAGATNYVGKSTATNNDAFTVRLTNKKHGEGNVSFVINEDMTKGYETGDIPHLMSIDPNAPYIVNKAGDKLLRTNKFSPIDDVVILPLEVSTAEESGLYIFHADGLDNFDEYDFVYLKDAKTNQLIDLRENEYSFINDQKLYGKRFTIILSRDELNTEIIAGIEKVSINKYESRAFDISLNFDRTTNIEVNISDLSGRVLQSIQLNNIQNRTERVQIDQSIASGMYLISIRGEDFETTEKIFIGRN